MPPDIVCQVDDVRRLIARWRAAGDRVALVPTMGNLHDGHISLARLAREHADRVLMSVFVNRTQFGADEDFGTYPRTLNDDRRLADESGAVDALFAPDEHGIYPFGTSDAVGVTMPALAGELCGASRPGHFDGVGSVVCRFLNITQPDVLVLGRKDYQQLRLLERMVADLHVPVRVVSGATLREADGLALSSRNRYLSGDERRRAPALHAVLVRAAHALLACDVLGAEVVDTVVSKALQDLREAGFRTDYVEARRADNLAAVQAGDRSEELVVLAAAWLGRARLLDNVTVADALPDAAVSRPSGTG